MATEWYVEELIEPPEDAPASAATSAPPTADSKWTVDELVEPDENAPPVRGHGPVGRRPREAMPEVTVTAEGPIEPEREEVVYTAGVATRVKRPAKFRESSWGQTAAAAKTAIGANIETKIAGAHEYAGASQQQDAKKKLWQSMILPKAVRDAAASGINLTEHPDVIDAAERAGVRPDVFARDWPSYVNRTPEDLSAFQNEQRARMQQGASRAMEGAQRRQLAVQVVSEDAPKLPEWSAKKVAFDVATNIPDLLAGAAAATAAGPAAGLAVMGGLVAPQYYAEGRNRGLEHREAETYSTLMSMAEVVPELPLFEFLDRTPAGVAAKKAVADSIAATVAKTAVPKVAQTALIEGLSESTTEALQIGIESGLLDEDTPLPEALQRIAYAGLVGAAMGGGVATIHGGIEGGVEAADPEAREVRTLTRDLQRTRAQRAQLGGRVSGAARETSPPAVTAPVETDTSTPAPVDESAAAEWKVEELVEPTEGAAPPDLSNLSAEYADLQQQPRVADGNAPQSSTERPGGEVAAAPTQDAPLAQGAVAAPGEAPVTETSDATIRSSESPSVRNGEPGTIDGDAGASGRARGAVATREPATIPARRPEVDKPAAESGTVVPESVTPAVETVTAESAHSSAIDAAAHAAATSPQSDLPEPTDAQKKAGNYKKGHIRLHGLDISIENPKGSERRGVDRSGKKWKATLAAHYGYIRGTTGKDKDHLDIYLGPTVNDAAGPVFVMDQKTSGGRFDEHKIFAGFLSEDEVIATYFASFNNRKAAATFEGPIRRFANFERFREWLDTGDHTKPVRQWKSANEPARRNLKDPDPAFDSVLEFLTKSGGVSIEEAESEGFDPADLKSHLVGIKRAFHRGGMSLESAGEALAQAGYDVMEDGRVDKNRVLDLLDSELRGAKRYSVNRETSEVEREAAQYEAEREAARPVVREAEAEIERLEAELETAAAWAEYVDYLQAEVETEARYDRIAASEVAEERAPAEGEGGARPHQGELREAPAARPEADRAQTPREGAREGLTLTAPAAAPPAAAPRAPKPPAADLFGPAPVAQQAIADATRAKDRKRNAGQDSIETGRPDDLFSQARQQTDLADAPAAAAEKPKRTRRARAGAIPPHPTHEQYKLRQDADEMLRADRERSRTDPQFQEMLAGFRKSWEDFDQFIYDGLVYGFYDVVRGADRQKLIEPGGQAHAFLHAREWLLEKNSGEAQSEATLPEAPYTEADEQVSQDHKSSRKDLQFKAMLRAVGAHEWHPTSSAYYGLVMGFYDASRGVDRTMRVAPGQRSSYNDAWEWYDKNVAKNLLPSERGGTREVETVKPGEKGIDRQRKDKALKKFLLAKRPQKKDDRIVSYRSEAVVGLNKAIKDGAPQEIVDQLRVEYEWALEQLAELYPDTDWRTLQKKGAPPSDAGVPEKYIRPMTREELLAEGDATVFADDEEVFDEDNPPPNEPPPSPKPRARRAATPKATPNKVFTEDAAAKARALLKKKLGQITSGVDPEVLQAGITLAGYHIEKGARTFAAYARAMIEDLGEAVRPYLKSWYMGVKYDPRAASFEGMSSAAEVESTSIEGDFSAERSSSNLEPDRATRDDERVRGEVLQPEPGRPDAGDAGTGGRARSEGSRSGRGERVSEGGAAPRGAGRDQPVRSAEPGRPDLFAGSDFGAGSLDARQPGATAEHIPAETVERAARSPVDLEAKRKKQRAAEILKVKPGDLANIRETLPFLNEGQQNDVHFAEIRFAKPDGYGVMFTNGTGTGKTYTGLGIVKRYARQGKTNIVITAPNDKIISDWIRSGANLGLDITKLEDTKSAGKGVVITTYANFGQNNELVKRKWDLILTDESHYLGSNEDGDITDAGRTVRALAYHPDGYYQRAIMLNPELYDRITELQQRLGYLQMRLMHLQRLKEPTDEEKKEAAAIPKEAADKSKELEPLQKQWQVKVDAAREDVKAKQGAARPRVAFLSATPFAYRKSIEYAEGFLFDYPPESTGGGYNSASGRNAFFVQNFGYRMRYNKLTEPDADVDTSIMEVQFNAWLKKQGVLSSRVLDVDADYERRFVLVSDAIGQKIDEAFEFLRSAHDGRYYALYELLRKTFDYHHRMYLLEAIKARAFVPIIKAELAAGRKVVVFHDFNKGGAFHPFHFPKSGASVIVKGEDEPISIAQLVEEFEAERPDLVALDFDADSPLVTMGAEFPKALFFNGTVPKAQRLNYVDRFNSDDGLDNLIVIQSDAGREGISLHDTTGKYRRTLLNLGMPVRPTAAIQIEGRTRRTGSVSNALYLYGNTGTIWERIAFAMKIAERSSTAENLAMGEDARALKEAYIEAFGDAVAEHVPSETDGRGGKAKDKASRKAMSEFERAKTYYFGQQKKTSRNKAAEGVDYFATPEPLAYKMVEWAGIRTGEHVLEPSAGHGAIARFFPKLSKATLVEPSSELGSRAALVSDGKLVNERFENHHIVNKYDAVVMNPPFGFGGKTAMEHVSKAADHLRDGGRLVALIPRGTTADKRFEQWLYGKDGEGGAKDMYLVADIQLPSVTFERAGTTVSARVVVLDKVSKPELARSQASRDYTDAEDIKAFFDRIENATVPDRPILPSPEETPTPVPTPTTNPATAAARQTGGSRAPPAATGLLEAAQTKHTKTGKDLFVARLTRRVLDDVYNRLRAKAKEHGGWYSSFKAAGAIPGFQFETKEARDAFIKAASAPANITDGPALRMREGASSPIFYSAAIAAAEALPQPKASGPQWYATISQRPGVKPEELEWMDLKEWLDDRKVVTRDELLDYMRANEIQVEEVVKGAGQQSQAQRDAIRYAEQLRAKGYEVVFFANGTLKYISEPLGGERVKRHLAMDDPDFTDLPADARVIAVSLNDALVRQMPEEDGGPRNDKAAQYGQYTLPGGENYRELLLTLPMQEHPVELLTALPDGYEIIKDGKQFGVIPPGQTHAKPMVGLWETEEQARQTALNQINFQRRQEGWRLDRINSYESQHFTERNVLAHVRFNERTDTDGKRVLFIEEVQSDWHQQGRKQGYRDLSKPWEVFDLKTGYVLSRHASKDEARTAMEGTGRNDVDYGESAGPPDAPFKTTWPDLVMKRMVRWAAENGFDRVAWAPGQVHVDRYGLEKHIGSMEVVRLNVDSGNHVYRIKTKTPDGTRGPSLNPAESELAEAVGEELARKIIANPEQEQYYSGMDLRVGGEGQRGFYDDILPKTVTKLIRKWGGKVRKGLKMRPSEVTEQDRQFERDNPEIAKTLNALESAHVYDVTPEMRDAALGGQPLFNVIPARPPRSPVPAASLKAHFAKIVGDLEGADVRIVEGVKGVEDGPQKTAMMARGYRDDEWGGAVIKRRNGTYTLYINARGVDSIADAELTFWHEGTHRGFYGVLGGKAYGQFLDYLFTTLGGRPTFEREIGLYFDERHPFNINTPIHRQRVADEYLAKWSERVMEPGFAAAARRVVNAIKAWLDRWMRERGWRRTLSNAEIEDTLRRMSRHGARNPQPTNVGQRAVVDMAKWAAKQPESDVPYVDDEPAMSAKVPPASTSGPPLAAAFPVPQLYRAYQRQVQSWIDVWNRKIGWRYGPLGRLPDQKTYLKERYLTLGKIGNTEEIARGIYDAFVEADPQDAQAIYNYLTTAGAAANAIQNVELRNKARAVKRLIDKVGRALVATGLLSQQAYQTHADAYLPRVYLRHMLGDDAMRAFGQGKRPSDMGYLKARKAIPQQVRELVLGEILDPAFLSSFSLSRTLRDLAIIGFLNKISAHHDWILAGQLVNFNGRQVTPQWLKAEAAHIREQAKFYAPPVAARAKMLADNMEQAANQVLNQLAPNLKDFAQVPDSHRYGMLRGMWVRREIFDDLIGAQRFLDPDNAGWAEKFLGQGGIATKLTQWWKMSKVALNPPSQVRNFISNQVLLHLSGVPLRRVYTGELLVRAIREIKNGGRFAQIAKRYGLFSTTFSNVELARIEREWLDLQARRAGTASPAHLKAMGAAIVDGASDMYGLAEAVTKIAKIIDAIDREGMSESDAVLEAQKWLFDYSLVPKSVQFLRNAPIGVPFITFSYKVLPRMLEVAAKHPARLAMYAAIPWLVAGMIADDEDVEREDVERLKKSLPDWLREKSGVMILPYRDSLGRWQAFNFGYYLPWTMFTDVAQKIGAGKPREALDVAGIPSGPVMDVGSALATNIDPFTKREIVNPNDPAGEQVAQLFGYVWNLAAPPWAGTEGDLRKITRAATDQVHPRTGEPGQTLTQAALRMFGAGIYPIDPEQSRAANLRSMSFELDELQRRMSERMRDRTLSLKQREDVSKTYRRLIEEKVEQIREYEKESRVHPNLRKKAG